MRDLIIACRASNPEDRPDAREVFKRLSAVIHSSSHMQRAWSTKSTAFDSPSALNSQSLGRRPSWAIPDDVIEGANFMAAIHEDEAPLTTAGSMSIDQMQGIFTTGSTMRKSPGDMRSSRGYTGHCYKSRNSKSRDCREGRFSCEELRSSERATSL